MYLRESTKCRACARCKVYITIFPGNAKGKKMVEKFELDHRGHPILTMDLNEVKDRYDSVNKDYYN